MPIRDPLDAERLSHLYRERFADQDQAFRERAWDILCQLALQRYVKDSDTVLDLGAGRCEFITQSAVGRRSPSISTPM